MDNSIVAPVVRLLLSGLSVLIVGALLPGIKVKSYGSAVLFALVVAVLNVIAWVLLAPLTWTFTALTIGIGFFVINALVFLIGSRIVSGVQISGWITALLASLGVSFVNWVLGLVFPGVH